MSFHQYKENGDIIRNAYTLDCSCDEPITEQSHKAEVNINNIIKKHGLDLIQKTANLQSKEYTFDDLPNNDFQEAWQIIKKAEESFMTMPSQVRNQFNNDTALFLDFVQNPENNDKLIDMGLAHVIKPDAPIKVEVANLDNVTPVEGKTDQGTPAE